MAGGSYSGWTIGTNSWSGQEDEGEGYMRTITSEEKIFHALGGFAE